MNNEDEYQGAGSFKLVTKLLKLFSPDRLREEIEGDLAQKFEYDRKRFGERRAKNRLLWNTIRFIRPGIILRNKINTRLNTVDMIQNYFKIAFRNSMKQKSYTLLNVAGLSLGIAASLLIFQYVKYERSFDKFHNKSDDIYRIQYNWWQNGKLNFESAVSVPAVGRAFKR
ncbi:MAG: permease prefix domain 2-containing transporter [Bacteroidota bacterium]